MRSGRQSSPPLALWPGLALHSVIPVPGPCTGNMQQATRSSHALLAHGEREKREKSQSRRIQRPFNASPPFLSLPPTAKSAYSILLSGLVGKESCLVLVWGFVSELGVSFFSEFAREFALRTPPESAGETDSDLSRHGARLYDAFASVICDSSDSGVKPSSSTSTYMFV